MRDSWSDARQPGLMTARGRGTILFNRRHRQPPRRQGLCGIRIGEIGLRAVAQAMARELGPKNIHVMHLIIDAGVDSAAIHARLKAASGIEAKDIAPNSLTKTDSIAEAYWFVHQQARTAGPTNSTFARPGKKW